jgi:hypothetical protein
MCGRIDKAGGPGSRVGSGSARGGGTRRPRPAATPPVGSWEGHGLLCPPNVDPKDAVAPGLVDVVGYPQYADGSGGAQSPVPGLLADREDAVPPLPALLHPRRMIAVLGDRLALCPARDLRTVVLMVLSKRPFASKKPTPIRAVSLCPLCVHGLSRSISTPRFPGGLLCFVVCGFTRRAGLGPGAILQNGCAAGIGISLLTRTCDCGGDRFRMRGYHAAALAAGWVGLNL